MSLTDGAKEAARYLVIAWDAGVIGSFFYLVDVTAGPASTVELASGLGVLKGDEFSIPPLGHLMELASPSNGELIQLSEQQTSRGRRWKVVLTQDLRDAVNHGLIVPRQDVTALARMPSFFISYKSNEQHFTEELATRLRRVYGSNQVWFDKRIYAGQQWWDEIIRKLREHEFFIFLLTREALESVYCRAELTEAWRFRKQLIPLLMREATYPACLSGFQFVKLPLGYMDIEKMIEVFATIVQRMGDMPPVVRDGQWDTRSIHPVTADGIQANVKVLANKEPGSPTGRPFCNTGILLVKDDQVIVTATGRITVDDGQSWCGPDGVFTYPSDPNNEVIHPRDDAYNATGYPTTRWDVGDKGVVGSLIGWIGEEESSVDHAFFVGHRLSKTISKGGEGFLHLAVNDTRGAYTDNKEAFDVRIEVRHPE